MLYLGTSESLTRKDPNNLTLKNTLVWFSKQSLNDNLLLSVVLNEISCSDIFCFIVERRRLLSIPESVKGVAIISS